MVTHGGDLRKLARIAGLPRENLLDFSASINPLGPPPWLEEVIASHLGDLARYPDPQCSDLVEALASSLEIPSAKIVPANGSSELIAWLPRVLEAKTAVIPVPAYTEYEAACKAAGLKVKQVLLEEAQGFVLDFGKLAAFLRGDEVVFLGRPNNPTGQLFSAEEFLGTARAFSTCWFVVDEAFIDFVSEQGEKEPQRDCERQEVDKERLAIVRAAPPNVVVVRSLTKFFAVPGLRLGFAVAPVPIAEALREAMPPWSVNVLAQAVGAKAVTDAAYAGTTREFVWQERRWLVEQLAKIPGLRVFPSVANYLLLRLKSSRAELLASELALRLLGQGIAIRTCADLAGLDDRYFRIAVRTRSENERLVAALGALLGRPGPQPHSATH